MATEHDFHLGPKTDHAQGDLLGKTESPSTSPALGEAQTKAGDAAEAASHKAQEGQARAGNIFQRAGDAIKGTVNETVHEVQDKLGRDDPSKIPMPE
ncbi:hypothetical protein R1sor_004535 [Riccia sorocarpa]|uniref:Uncharacterized protein n=1 Tax=Riccia sorocarpa TaxID=122646 RepID=A0ABD3HKG4_9MARC